MSNLPPQKATRALAILAMAFFFIFAGAGAQQQYVLPYLHENLSWAEIYAAAALAGVYIGEAFLRVLNLAFVARLPDNVLSAIGSLTYVMFPAAVGLSYFTKSWHMLLMAGLVWGWGGALLWTGSSMQALRYGEALKDRHGLGTGVLYIGTHLGFLTGVIVLGIIHAHASLRPYITFLVAAAVTAVGSGLLFTIPATAGRVAETLTWSSFVQALRRVKVQVATFLMFCSGLAFGMMLGPLGRHIADTYGPQWLWITASFFPIARAVVAFGAGLLADYFSAGALLCIAFMLASGGLAAATGWASPAAMGLAAFSLGLLQGTVPVVATAMVGKSAERTRRALPHAIIFTGRDIGVTLAVLASMGAHQQVGTFLPIFGAFAVVFAVCGAASLLLTRYAHERI